MSALVFKINDYSLTRVSQGTIVVAGEKINFAVPTDPIIFRSFVVAQNNKDVFAQLRATYNNTQLLKCYFEQLYSVSRNIQHFIEQVSELNKEYSI